MAITPRSFILNPSLQLVVASTVVGVSTLIGLGLATVSSDYGECVPTNTPMSQWSEYEYMMQVQCLSEQGSHNKAYQTATVGISEYPVSPALLNLKGFVAARSGDHAGAVHDFRTGQRITGSPSGVFENNIAWSTLYQVDRLPAARSERVLLQARQLYTQSLEKGWSCERVHTGLFVEYGIADAASRTRGVSDAQVAYAVDRYTELYASYAACWQRVVDGDELAVEEIFAAAVIDAEMGTLAGVGSPTRHQRWLDAATRRSAQLGLTVDDAFCDKAVPVANATAACKHITD